MAQQGREEIRIYAPFAGSVIPIDEVKDPVFSQKMLGDGCALRLDVGNVYAPVDGEIISIAASKHAFGFRTPEGVEILVHVGLETVNLKGDGFTPQVKVGDTVKHGDLICTVDVDLLKSKDIDLITPVLICDITGQWKIECTTGDVAIGDVLFTAEKVAATEASAEKPATAADSSANKESGKGKAVVKASEEPPKKRKMPRMNFDFLQRFGKTLIAVIVVMPAAGLLISLGKLVEMCGADISFVLQIGTIMEAMGWGIINNLNILFAIAIGGSWGKDKAGGAFAAMIGFITIAVITGSAFGVTADVLANATATTPVTDDPSLPLAVSSVFGQSLAVKDYFTLAAGIPCLNMGVFIGIISGFLGGVMYNKFYNFNKLPAVLTFFNGKRFVPLATIGYATLVSIVICMFWPFAQGAINGFGEWVVGSSETAPFIAPFVYGTTERLLLPFGLHHMLTIPLNYTTLGGTYSPVDGSAAVMGQDPIWLAWVADLGKAAKEGNWDLYNQILNSQTPGRFKVGQVIGSSAMLIGFGVAMYKRAEFKHKKATFSLIFSAAAATILTGVTEPLEFMFMFAATPLYVVYAIIQGLCFGMADVVPMRLSAFGDIELLTRMPMGIQAGLWMDYVWFAVMCVIFFFVGYGVAYFLIGKFKFATPGRLGNYVESGDDASSDASAAGGAGGSASARINEIIELLGGASNIDIVDACMTRLRVTVNDPSKVEQDPEMWKKKTKALGLLVKGEGVQIIYGPEADVIKNDVCDALGK